jgi:hypothetical protein
MPQSEKHEGGQMPEVFSIATQWAQLTATPASDLIKLATALHLTSDQVETDLAARALRQAASKLEEVAAMLKDPSPQHWLRALPGLARARPAVFITGALALGFAGARFFKSVEPSDREPRTTGDRHGHQEQPKRKEEHWTQPRRGAAARRRRFDPKPANGRAGRA